MTWTVSNAITSCIQVTCSIYNLWSTKRTAKRAFAVAGRVVPIFLAAITIGLLQTPQVQSSFTAYMIVANAQCEFNASSQPKLPLLFS
jgi:hypothetical protein